MIWIVMLLSTLFGASLAWTSSRLGQPVAWAGSLLLLSLAFAIRRRWHVLIDLAPGSPERKLWICLCGASAVAAHLAASIVLIGPKMPMHSEAMHRLGIDSWTLVGAAVAAYLVVRERNARSDERDVLIAHQARRFAWHFELYVMSALIVALGFGWMANLSHSAIAHVLILLLTLTMVAESAVSLRAYHQQIEEPVE